MSRRLIFSIAAVLAVAACSEQDSTAPNEAPLAAAVGSNSQAYVISYSAAQSGDLSQAITRAGGKMKKLSSGAGLATATASNADFAQRRTRQGRQNPQKGGLAGAIRTQQRDELARLDLKVDAAQDRF